jgi:5-oxoprolinase (ATP-hydrolysing)
MSRAWEVWVDTGGTFTDCIARDPAGETHRVKVLSTSALRCEVAEPRSGSAFRISAGWDAPADFPVGFECRVHGETAAEERAGGGVLGTVRSFDPGSGLLGLDPASAAGDSPIASVPAGATLELRSPEPAPLLAARLVTRTPAGRPLPEGLRLRLATTRGTNALLERRGAPLVLFVTRGFRDVLRIGDQQRPDLFSLDVRRPPPLAVRVVEVQERISADGSVLEPLSLEGLDARVEALFGEGIEAAAVSLLHAHRNPAHEERLAAFLREKGFPYVAASAETAPFIHLLRRTETTAVEGYLGPVIRRYVDRIREVLPGDRLLVMTSAGGLVRGSRVRAKDTLLSGPAGGVVGAALVGRRAGEPRVIAFDMGGTSTDVSRIDGDYEYREEHRVGAARLRAPALAIETVAAGGGSICSVDPAGGLRVGPASAGADPGPACYGAGGPLTLTDVNLLLGRIDPRRFEIPVRRGPAEDRAREALEVFCERTGESPRLEILLEGFLELADERMADAVRRISVRKGYDPAEYALVTFGGAGPQHACALADRLGIERVLVPAEAGVLSARGLGHAVIERFRHRQVLAGLEEVGEDLPSWFAELEARARAEVRAEGVPEEAVTIRQRVLHLRYHGQESTLEIPFGTGADLRADFEEAYRAVYGHRPERRPVEVESLRVVASAPPHIPEPAGIGGAREAARPEGELRGWFDGGWDDVPAFERDALPPGAAVEGPALVGDRFSVTVVQTGWRCRKDDAGTLRLERRDGGEEARGEEARGAAADSRPVTDAASRSAASRPGASRSRVVEEDLFVQRFRSLVGEMGEQLRRTALSVNIRERLDFSCALLDAAGRLVANAPHIPVHLGAMGVCVRRVAETLPLEPGDVAVTNHPGFGGSHLPDVTVVTPVFLDDVLLGYVASRAHHAEMGGTRPGSMPPDAGSLQDEGVVIAPRHLVRGGEARWEQMRRLLSEAPHPSRAVEENLVDLAAQVAANHRGAGLLRGLGEAAGRAGLARHMEVLRGRAEARMRQVLAGMADGTYLSEERLDDGTPLRAGIRVEGDGAVIDFSGSGGVHPGNLNATEAVVRSAVLYVLRLLAGEELPLNEGLLTPVTLRIPEGILNPTFPDDPASCPAVVGGNVETSQRLVDTLLKPFEIAACSQGTMNNLLFGDAGFSYYETIGGGAGAGPGFHGGDATQVHMTNTRITDVEVLEHRFPVRVERFAVREGSGGTGRWRGGDGIVRELRFLRPLSVSVLTQHRREAPYGIRGGAPGAVGGQRWILASGEERELGPVDACEVEAGDRIVVETPGGGGCG